MEHRKLDALMTPVERIARVAAAGVNLAKAPQTAPSGAISLDNADGTRTIIGEVVNGEDNPSYTMATHVGDTTPPGVPTGITATSKSGVVVVEWDGTLDGGIPDDFFCVRIYLDGTELGALTEAGSVASAKLDGGTTVLVTATSEDDCCLADGTPDHNVSAASQAISVTVSSSAEEIIVDVEEEIEGVQQEISDFKEQVQGNYYNKTTIDKKTEAITNEVGAVYRDSMARNLGPFYDRDFEDVRSEENPDGYWVSEPKLTTRLDDGWAHIVMDNSSGTGTMYATVKVAVDAMTVVGGTLLVEVKNLVGDVTEASGHRLWFNPHTTKDATIQVYGSPTQWWWEDGDKYFTLAVTDAASPTYWCDMWFGINAGHKAEFDARLSYYQGEYTGDYKPYNADTANLTREYATKTWTEQTAEDYSIGAAQKYTATIANPNLSPFFEHPGGSYASRGATDYWTSNLYPYGSVEQYRAGVEVNGSAIGDGWAHYEVERDGLNASDAATTSFLNLRCYSAPYGEWKAGTRYTLLAEFRNVTFLDGDTRGRFVFRPVRKSTASTYSIFESATDVQFYVTEGATLRIQLKTYDELTDARTQVLDGYLGFEAGCRVSFDVRLSIYENATDSKGDPITYAGNFKPYVTGQDALSKEYSTKAELRVGLDSVTSEVTKAYESIDATTLAPFSDSVEGYLTSTAAGSATDPLHEPDARKERTSDYFDVTPGASYTFKGKATNESATDWMWRTWRFYDADGKTLGTRQGGNVGQGADEFEVTFTAPDDAASCRVSMTCFEDGRWQVLGDLTKTTADLNSSIKQTAESIESTVSAQVADVRVLGENILRNVVRPEIAGQVMPSDYDGKWFGSSGNQGAIVSAVDVTDSPQAGVTRAFHIDNSAYTGNRDAAQRIPDGIKAGEQMAFSAWARAVGSDCRAQVRMWNTAAPTGAKFTWSKVVGTTWERIVIPVTLTADTDAGNFMIGINGKGIIEWIAPVLLQGVDADLLAQEVENNYTKSSTFTQTVNGLDGRITATEDGLAVQETLIRQYAGGVLVAYTGNSVGALVNAAGQYDIVSLTWQGGEPTVGTTLAKFGQESQIGQESDTFLGIDSRSMRLTDGASSQTYFEAADLRGDDGVATLTSTYIADGITATQAYEIFILPLESIEEVTGVTLDGTATTRFYVQNLNEVVVENTTKGQAVAITYTTESVLAKAYTLGIRRGGSDVGAMSVAEGIYTMAQGAMAHAEGSWTQANGEASHAGGESTRANGPRSFAHGTDVVADLDSQVVVGKYNALGLNSLFEVGTGDPTMRESGFWVGEDGATRIGTYGTAIAGVFFGSKVVNPAGAAYATLFTSAEAVTEFGQAPNAARDIVVLTNGDPGAYQGQMTAALTGGNIRAYFSPTKNGNIRVNYLVIIGA